MAVRSRLRARKACLTPLADWQNSVVQGAPPNLPPTPRQLRRLTPPRRRARIERTRVAILTTDPRAAGLGRTAGNGLVAACAGLLITRIGGARMAVVAGLGLVLADAAQAQLAGAGVGVVAAEV